MMRKLTAIGLAAVAVAGFGGAGAALAASSESARAPVVAASHDTQSSESVSVDRQSGNRLDTAVEGQLPQPLERPLGRPLVAPRRVRTLTFTFRRAAGIRPPGNRSGAPQADDRVGAAAGRGRELDLAAVGLDQLADDREAEAGARQARTSSRARSGRTRGRAAPASCPGPRRARVARPTGRRAVGRHGHGRPGGRVLERVRDEVVEHLDEPLRPARNRRGRRRRRPRGARAARPPAAARSRRGRGRTPPCRRAPAGAAPGVGAGEREQALDELRRAARPRAARPRRRRSRAAGAAPSAACAARARRRRRTRPATAGGRRAWPPSR